LYPNASYKVSPSDMKNLNQDDMTGKLQADRIARIKSGKTSSPDAYKRGGKVKKYADGGLATSVRPAADENMADNAFVNERAAQLRNMVGKAKGGAVKAAVHKHERAMHPGKPLTKLKKGGMTSC
jgi:hypothetical protein